MPEFQRFSYDVLIIGAGGAGLRAAIEAAATGAKVGVVCKSLLGKAHTVMAEGGVAAALGNVDDRDNWRVHFSDTMRGGQYLNNWRMAELHAKEAPDRVRELEAWGAVFDRTPEGRILQRNFGGHRYPRLAHVGDRTGLELIRTLQDHGIHQGITVHMEWTIVTLLKDGNRVVGAFGYDRERGRFKVFKAKAVVVCSGGLGRAYKVTSNSWEGTGDGHSLAYHAGADLLDMEFIQFHPTGMIWPPSVMGILVTESVRGEGGVLKNKEGRRFTDEAPGPVDATYEQITRTLHHQTDGIGYVILDARLADVPNYKTAIRTDQPPLRAQTIEELADLIGVSRDDLRATIDDYNAGCVDGPYDPTRVDGLATTGVRPAKSNWALAIDKPPYDAYPIISSNVFTYGGLKVDPSAHVLDTSGAVISGLYAAGETVGMYFTHYAGSTSVLKGAVFGKLAGAAAAGEGRP